MAQVGWIVASVGHYEEGRGRGGVATSWISSSRTKHSFLTLSDTANMTNFPYVLLIELFLAVLSNALADYPLWDGNCSYTLDAWNHANATGTYSIQGISATQSHLANATFNWTIYDTVTRFRYGSSNFPNNQFFWLDSSNTSQAASEPLKGCVYGLQGLPSNLVKKGQDDTGDCASILDADCINDLKTQFGGLSDGTVVDGKICQPPLSISLPNCKKYAPKGSTDGSFWAGTVSGSKTPPKRDESMLKI